MPKTPTFQKIEPAKFIIFGLVLLAGFLLSGPLKAQAAVQNWYFHNGAGDGAGFWWYDYKNI